MRTDIHSPKSIIPADYHFVGFSYLGPEYETGYSSSLRAIISAHMTRTGGRYSGHAHGGSCHICGAHALYMAVFHHPATNVYIKAGLDCTDKMGMDSGNGEAFRSGIRSENKAIAGKKKAKKILEESGAGKAWEIYETTTENRFEENTISDIVAKLVKYGSISDKAMAFVSSLLSKIENRATVEAARAERHALAATVPTTDTRVMIEGKVISHKFQDSAFGTVHKMLIEATEGFRLWGTVPNGLDIETGIRVKFQARITKSDRDEKFGFFQRPSKAEIVN